MNPIDNNEILRERTDPRRNEPFAETPLPLRAGVNAAKSVNLSVSTATANAGTVRRLSGEKFKPADGNTFSRYHLAAPSSAAGSIDLEWFVGMFQIKSDEAAVNANRSQLLQEKASLKPKHDRVIDTIRTSVDAMKNSESAKKLQRILGVATAVASIVGAIFAVFTFGASLAAGLAIASAVLAVTGSMLSLTGGDEALVKKLAEVHKKCSGATDEDADKFAQQFYAFFGMGVNIAVGVGGGVAGIVTSAREGVTETAKLVGQVSVASTSFAASALESGGGANAAIKNTAATIQQAQQRVTEANMRQQANMVDQIVDELDRSVERLFADWSAFDEVIQRVASTKGELATNIAKKPV